MHYKLRIPMTLLNKKSKVSIETHGCKLNQSDSLSLSIELSKNRPFQKVLFGLGIRHVGETVAMKLANEFKSIDNLINSDGVAVTPILPNTLFEFSS